ncbi:hypothetical protein EDB92DRAFT_1818918 [Lactarius akahatsu]|uniref:Uncharacterized protein n=1 Tax=Lactarius akahatsu TaxID=416441 RepID=A0AAD4L8V3_9AGAM|nr:hypothetical protein EDB92DRAFT_1818918 [Lactarius akahatsu]
MAREDDPERPGSYHRTLISGTAPRCQEIVGVASHGIQARGKGVQDFFSSLSSGSSYSSDSEVVFDNPSGPFIEPHHSHHQGSRNISDSTSKVINLTGANPGANGPRPKLVNTSKQRDTANFLGTEASIFYSQAFSTIPGLISAFEKRGDIVVSNRDIDTDVLLSVEKGRKAADLGTKKKKKSCRPLMRRFLSPKASLRGITITMLVTMQNSDSTVASHTSLIDRAEAQAQVSPHSRQQYLVQWAEPDAIFRYYTKTSSPASSPHQAVSELARGSSGSFISPAAVPTLLTVSASESIDTLRNTPSILSTLQVCCDSHTAPPIIHTHLHSAAPSVSAKPPNPSTPAPREARSSDISGEEPAARHRGRSAYIYIYIYWPDWADGIHRLVKLVKLHHEARRAPIWNRVYKLTLGEPIAGPSASVTERSQGDPCLCCVHPLQSPTITSILTFLAIRTRNRAGNGENHFLKRPKLATTGKQGLNLASYNSTSLGGNETTKFKLCAIEILRNMVPVVVASWIQRHYRCPHGPLARHNRFPRNRGLNSVLAWILDNTLGDLCPCKTWRHIVADRGINFAVQKGVLWFAAERGKTTSETSRTSYKTTRYHRGFENGGAMVDLPKLATLLNLILGSVANGFTSSGAPAPVPALLVAASEGINILRNMTSTLENVRAIRVEAITIPSHAALPIIHIHMRPAIPAPHEAPSFDITGEERLLRDIVNEALAQGVWITRARRLRGQELGEECERAGGVKGRRREGAHEAPMSAPAADPELSRLTFLYHCKDYGPPGLGTIYHSLLFITKYTHILYG